MEKKELLNHIMSLRDCATGWDDVPSILFKTAKENLVEPLCHIINLSLQQGKVPEKCKIANIIPLFKSGAKDIQTNYRPISLLTTISKLYEKAMHKRMTCNLVLRKRMLLIW